LRKANLTIFGAPYEMFSRTEFSAMKNHIETGGKILILMNEGGEMK